MCLFEVYGKWLVQTNMYVYTDVCNARLAPIVELTCASMISWVRDSGLGQELGAGLG